MYRSLGMRALAFVMMSLGAWFALGADCATGNTCTCFPCTSAIDLKVSDTQGNALTADWTVEATVDGKAVDDIANCDPGSRFGNECTFGTAPGIYRITVRSPGFQTKQIAARFAAKSGEDCCRCLGVTPVDVILDAAAP